MHRVIAILFAISCIATSLTSANILGVGIWFWIISATGLLVAVSQFVPAVRQLGSVAALLLAVVAVLAVVFTLLAATIGGSFELDGGEAFLVFGFVMIAISGFLLVRVNRNIPP